MGKLIFALFVLVVGLGAHWHPFWSSSSTSPAGTAGCRNTRSAATPCRSSRSPARAETAAAA